MNFSIRGEENNCSSAQFLSASPVKEFRSKNKIRMELSVPGSIANIKRSSLLERKKSMFFWKKYFFFLRLIYCKKINNSDIEF